MRRNKGNMRRALVAIVATSMLTFGGMAAAGPVWSTRRPSYGHCRWFRCTTTTKPSTTTVPPTTIPSTTTSQVPTTTSSPTTTTIPGTTCSGVPLTNGQADINANPVGTAFCMTGVHNWGLVPKDGNTITGGTLDGGGTTNYAFQGNAQNVTLNGVEVRNYRPANQQGAIAATGFNWTLNNLQVHDNGTTGNGEKWNGSSAPTGGGGGSTLGNAWHINGGRYYNNRQWGLGGNGTGTTLNGVEIDHNNFADDTYVRRNVDCDFEAGGLKWVNDNLTIENSSVHDNACRGIWADITGNNATITNNQVYNNWADGIMIEISSGAKITGNNVYGNGYKEWATAPGTATQSCGWMYGAGIFISTSSNNEVSGNTVTNNCWGITGAEQNRGASFPSLTGNSVHDNIVSGGGHSGMAADDGKNPATMGNVWTNNQFVNGATFCGLTC